jgi:glycosyltransferase involved in cell wall biosynthesis
MKILQINKFFFLKGGAERYFFDLSELLTKKGHQVSAWSTQRPRNFSWPDQEGFAQFNDLSQKEGFWKDFKKVRDIFWNREAKKKLEKLIRKEKPEMAHLHNIFSHLSPSIIFALKKRRIPIVLTLHDYKLFCPNYQFFSQGKICFDCLKKKNYYSCLSKKCIKNSSIKSLIGCLETKWQKDFLKIAEKIDIFLAPSFYMKGKALAWGIPAEKIIHLPYFVNNDFSGQSNLKGNPYFLYFGRLSQEKGIKFLIKTFLKASDKSLKIVGQGPQREKLEKLAKNGRKKIEFLGEKKGQQLKEIISEAYSIIVPSLWPENFPYTILESFALAKPVLATKVGGLPELVKNKQTGLLFEPNNQDDLKEKIIWASQHPREMKKMGQTAQKEVLAKYNSEKHYQKLIKIYERIKNN